MLDNDFISNGDNNSPRLKRLEPGQPLIPYQEFATIMQTQLVIREISQCESASRPYYATRVTLETAIQEFVDPEISPTHCEIVFMNEQAQAAISRLKPGQKLNVFFEIAE